MATESKERVRAHRQRLRAQGLRPIQLWVPDVSSPTFVAEAHRQSALAAKTVQAADDQDFADAAQASAWDEAEWRDG